MAGLTEAGPVVYVVDKESKVAVQRVEAGLTMYQGLRVVTKGLDEGIPVIVEGLQMIRPGMPVKAEPAVLARPVETAAVALVGDQKPIVATAEGQEPRDEARKQVVAPQRLQPSSEPAPSWPRSAAKKPANGADSHPK